MFGSPHPRDGHVRETIANVCDLLPFPCAELLLDGEQVCQDLARMLVIGKRVDGRNLGILREVHDVLLGEGPYDGAMHHATEDTVGVLDGLTPSELDVVFRKEHREAT